MNNEQRNHPAAQQQTVDFSGEYQSGADSILRCTNHGRLKLAVTRILASCTISVVTFMVILLALNLLAFYVLDRPGSISPLTMKRG